MNSTAPSKFHLKKWHWWAIGIGAVLVLGGIGSALGLGGDPDTSATPSATPTAAALTIPDVTGKPGDEARTALTDVGLKVEFDGGDQTVIAASNWTVDSQQPAAGSTVDEGATVTLKVTKPTPTATPDANTTSDGLTVGAALVACNQSGDDEFPYGFKLSVFSATSRVVADKWVISGEAKVENAYGNKRKMQVMCRVSGTDDSPVVEYFTHGD